MMHVVNEEVGLEDEENATADFKTSTNRLSCLKDLPINQTPVPANAKPNTSLVASSTCGNAVGSNSGGTEGGNNKRSSSAGDHSQLAVVGVRVAISAGLFCEDLRNVVMQNLLRLKDPKFCQSIFNNAALA